MIVQCMQNLVTSVSSFQTFPAWDCSPSETLYPLRLANSPFYAVHSKCQEFLGCLVAVRTSANTQSHLFCMHVCLPVVFSFLSCPAQVSRTKPCRTQHLTCFPLGRWWSFDSGGALQVSHAIYSHIIVRVLLHKSSSAPCLVGNSL